MPTLDDLREVLMAREVHAGDPATVQRYLNQHLHQPRPTRRYVAPTLAAVAVVSIAAGSVVIASDHDAAGRSEQPGRVASTSRTAPTPTSVKTRAGSPIVPTNALRWSFTMSPLPGYAFAYSDYQPDQENANVTSATDAAFGAGITVYARGAFDPSDGSVDGTAVHGKDVSINGHLGIFVAGPSTPTLYWMYAADSWADLGVDGIPGTTAKDGITTSAGATAAETAAALIARAVQITTSQPVTLPFHVNNPPDVLKIVDVSPHGARSELIYGTSFDPQNQYLSVACWTATDTVQYLPTVEQGANAAGARVLTRSLPDGSTIVAIVTKGHLTTITAAQQQAILDNLTLAPDLSDPKTWLPVTG